MYSAIGGNGTDGEDCQRYNGVGYGQHQQTLQQSSMTNHKPWKRGIASAWLTTARQRPHVVPSLTRSQEEDDTEHGQDGRNHHPEESVQLSGILTRSALAGVRRGIRLGTAHGRSHGEATHPRGDQRSAFIGHGCPQEFLARPVERKLKTGFRQSSLSFDLALTCSSPFSLLAPGDMQTTHSHIWCILLSERRLSHLPPAAFSATFVHISELPKNCTCTIVCQALPFQNSKYEITSLH